MKGNNVLILENSNDIRPIEYIKVSKLKTFLLCVYFFISFYEGYLNQIAGSFTKYYLIIIMIMFLVGYKKPKLEAIHFFLIFWLIFKLTSILWGTNNTVGADTVSSHFLSQIGMVAFFVVMTITKFDFSLLKKVVDVSLYASISMGILGLFFSEAYIFSVESRRVLTLFGNQIDPNNLAALYLVGFAIALYYIVFERKNILRNSIFVLVNGFAIGLTSSRGGIISVVFILIIFAILSNKRRHSVKDLLVKFFTIGIIAICLFFIASRFLPDESFERLFNFGDYTIGSGRDVLWSTAITLFKEKPLFGWGWGGYLSGIHNTYLSMLCDVGLFGSFLFLMPIIIICYRAMKTKTPLVIIILACGLAPAFYFDAINKRFFWDAIILATMILKSNKQPLRTISHSIARYKMKRSAKNENTILF